MWADVETLRTRIVRVYRYSGHWVCHGSIFLPGSPNPEIAKNGRRVKQQLQLKEFGPWCGFCGEISPYNDKMAKKGRNSKSNMLCSILEGESDGCGIDFFGYTFWYWCFLWIHSISWRRVANTKLGPRSGNCQRFSKVWHFNSSKVLLKWRWPQATFLLGVLKQRQDLWLFQIPRNDQTFVTFTLSYSIHGGFPGCRRKCRDLKWRKMEIGDFLKILDVVSSISMGSYKEKYTETRKVTYWRMERPMIF